MESPVHTFSVKHCRGHLFDRDSEATVASRRLHGVVCLFSRLAAWKNAPEKKRVSFPTTALSRVVPQVCILKPLS